MRFWRQKPLQRDFVSEIDRFLMEFDKRSEASSPTRRAEEAQYRAIELARDKAKRSSLLDRVPL